MASLPGQPWSAGTILSNSSGFCYMMEMELASTGIL